MQIRPQQLAAHLSRGLAPLYLIHGEEPLQQREALDAIRLAARHADYGERVVLDAEPGFDWQRLTAEASSLSLFAARRLLEVRLTGRGPGESGAKVLTAYAHQPPADTVLLVNAGNLDAKARKSRWVLALDKGGVVMHARSVELGQLPAWIGDRAKRMDLSLSSAATIVLAERVEGNMLACAQELEKLALLYPGQPLGPEQVLAGATNNARYDVFGLVDSALEGEASRSLRILMGLRSEGVEPPLVIWALSRELRALFSIASEANAGEGLEQVLSRHRVWDRRRPAVRAATHRHTPQRLLSLLRALGKVDRGVKGVRRGSPWEELGRVILALAGVDLPIPIRALSGRCFVDRWRQEEH